MSQGEVKVETAKEASPGIRPMGLTLSYISYGITGVYYLAYPFLVQDPSIIPLYVLGAFSLAGSYGVMKMTKWGLWLGLLLFPVQIIAPVFAIQAAMQVTGFPQNYEAIGFASSWIVLVILAALSFILVLDKRKSFA